MPGKLKSSRDDRFRRMNIERKEAVIVLGAGIMQIPAIKTASEEGFSVLAFDGNPEPAGRNFAELFFNIDIKDHETIYRKCIDLGDLYSVKGVFTAGTDFSYIVAKLAEKMALPGISYETALKATLKSEMRKAFMEKGVSSPGFIVSEGYLERKSVEEKLKYPLVVKPVDSMGGRGSVKIRSFEKLEEAVGNAIVFSRTGKVIIEEFIEGAEFSLDAVVENGKITICGIADRHIFFPPYFVEMGHTMPSIYPEEVQRKVSEVFEEGIRAIGIDNGAAKGDIKYDGKKAVIGEIAARLSGGYMSGWTFPYSSGISVIKAAINIALGRNSGIKSYRYEKTAAERAFISIPGKVDEIILPEYLEKKNTEEIKDIFFNVKRGDRVVFPRNNVEKCGNIIAVDTERENAVRAAEQGCRDIIIRLESCDSETEKFLLFDKEAWIPDAFILENSYNISSYRNMAEIIINKESKNRKTAVMGLPFPEMEKSLDWMGRGFRDSLERVFDITGAEIAGEETEYSIVIGRKFWDAFLSGGVQGGIWIIDTLEKYINGGVLPERFLS